MGNRVQVDSVHCHGEQSANGQCPLSDIQWTFPWSKFAWTVEKTGKVVHVTNQLISRNEPLIKTHCVPPHGFQTRNFPREGKGWSLCWAKWVSCLLGDFIWLPGKDFTQFWNLPHWSWDNKQGWWMGAHLDQDCLARHTCSPLFKPSPHVKEKSNEAWENHWASLLFFPVWQHWIHFCFSLLLLCLASLWRTGGRV